MKKIILIAIIISINISFNGCYSNNNSKESKKILEKVDVIKEHEINNLDIYTQTENQSSKEISLGEVISENSNKTQIITQETVGIEKTEKSSNKEDNIESQEIILDKDNEISKLYQKAFDSFFTNMYSDAIMYADKILEIDDQNKKAYNIKGIAICYVGDFQKGIELINKALEIDSEFEYAVFNKALALELFGHLDDALLWYDKSLDLDNNVWSYYGKASIYGRRGDVDNTVKYLKIAMDMDSYVIEHSKTEEDFDSVRGSVEFKNLFKTYNHLTKN